MKHSLSCLVVLLALCFFFPGRLPAEAPPATELVDRVVAVVNDDVITLSEVEEEGRDLFARILRDRMIGNVDRALAEARRQILVSLIDKKLVEQRAKELGISVDEEEIAMAMEQTAAANNMTVTEFQDRLAAEGIDVARYREGLRWQVLQSKLISFELQSRVVIPEERVRRYYEEHYTADTIGEGYHLLQIGIRWDEEGGRSREEARRKAAELRRRVLAGESFRDLARRYSELPSRERDGDVGTFIPDEMASFMRAAILPLGAGEVSELVETPDRTVQFFQVLSVKNGDTVQPPPLDLVRDDIAARLRDEELQRQFENWVKKLREQAYITQLL